MVAEATRADVEQLKKVSLGEITNLQEYVSLLNNIIETLEQDIASTRQKAKEFLKEGQKDNYGHLMERVHETILRIETCKKCVEECNADLVRKEERLREYNQFLETK